MANLKGNYSRKDEKPNIHDLNLHIKSLEKKKKLKNADKE